MTTTIPLRRARSIAGLGLGLATLALSAGVALAATAGDLDPSFDPARRQRATSRSRDSTRTDR
jgi:hypothetical protein